MEKTQVYAPAKKAMSSVDEVFVRIEQPSQLMLVSGLYIFDEPLTEEALIVQLDKWVRMFPTFQSRLVGKEWKLMPNYSSKDHLEIVNLPEPGGWKELEDFVSKAMSTPLSFEKPLWQAYYVKGFGNQSVYFVKVHHCISDGQGLVKVTLAITTQSEEEMIAAAGHMAQEKKRPVCGLKKLRADAKETAITLEKAFRNQTKGVEHLPYAKQTTHFMTRVLSTFQVFLLLSLLMMLLGKIYFYLAAYHELAWKWASVTLVPKYVFNKPGGKAKHVALSKTFDLDEAKAIGRAVGATLNDVIISTLTSSIRNYLISTNQLEKSKKGKGILCGFPVSLRAPNDWELGNKVTVALFKLPLDVEDPVERLAIVKKELDKIKNSNEASFSYFYSLLSLKLLPKWVMNLFLDQFLKNCDVLLTNVPGPKHQVKFAAVPIKEMYSSIPQVSVGGLGLAVISYNGKFTITVNADEGHIVPNTQALLDSFAEEFELLKQKVLGTNGIQRESTPTSRTVKREEKESEEIKKDEPKGVDSGFCSENSSDVEVDSDSDKPDTKAN